MQRPKLAASSRRILLAPCLGALFALSSCIGDTSGNVAPSLATGLAGTCGAAISGLTVNTMANTGRPLYTIGRTTAVGNFPTGGQLSPDGKYFWSISSGHGQNDVQIVSVATGAVTQVLPLPGAFGQVAFNPSGTVAYVSGEPQGSQTVGTTVGNAGDVIHVFHIAGGVATEGAPIAIPATSTGLGRTTWSYGSTGANSQGLTSWPAGLAVSPDGNYLVVALQLADQAVIFNLANGNAATLVPVGHYPFGVAVNRASTRAYVTNAYDGTVSTFTLSNPGTPAVISGLAAAGFGDNNSQPQGVLQDPNQDVLYVAVTNKDSVAVINETTNTVTRSISLQRKEGVFGSQPVSLALTPDGKTLLSANAGENAIVAIALADGSISGKFPTTDYPTAVGVTPDGCSLVWNSARGTGTGANPHYGNANLNGTPPSVNNNASRAGSPYPSYVMDLLTGQVGVSALPTSATFATLGAYVDSGVRPADTVPPPPATPIHGALVSSTNGLGTYAPSSQIKYVFLVVKENRTYDQLYGSDPRGNGDPTLEILSDNDSSCTAAPVATGVGCRNGVTPNQHALTRKYSLLDNFYSDSEVSVDGHVITTGAYPTNYTLKSSHMDYSGRGRPVVEEGIFPVTFAPKYFLFDEMAAAGLDFLNYGELVGNPTTGYEPARGLANMAYIAGHTNANVGAPLPPGFTYLNVGPTAYASNNFNGCAAYPAPLGPYVVNTPYCAYDSGMGAPPPAATNINAAFTGPQSRIDVFQASFAQQTSGCTTANAANPAACGAPQFNYLIMMSDHTNGVSLNRRDPFGMVADNDLGVGQLVQILSHSPIWPYTAIFVVEDDSQDGADHVDAHRAPALVISPYSALNGALVHTRYDQYSVLRTIELILGLAPLSANDAFAAPMYDAFATTPDNSTYTAITPQRDIRAVVTAQVAAADLSSKLPWDRADLIPAEISDRLLYAYAKSTMKGYEKVGYHGPGPNSSASELARARRVEQIYQATKGYPELSRKAIRYYLAATANDQD